ncbi:MAG: TetR/AcrR family transcriptional regulator [Dehalococcoidia bacterium]|nr:TetR/AcrR family transcriptional regulator [Dehalococcoidia bacterium]
MRSEKQDRERLSGENRKAQIIDIALTIFAQKGFAGTRTREIAEAAGISETLIFQHFKTKDELIRAALAKLFHAHPVSGELVKQLKKTDDDAGFFRTLALHFIKHNREDPRIMKLAIFSSIEGGHFWELTRSDETEPLMITLITDYIQKRINEGVFVKTNAGIAARLFIDAVFMHIADKSVAITGPPLPFSDDKVVETLIEIFIGGLKKSKARQ